MIAAGLFNGKVEGVRRCATAGASFQPPLSRLIEAGPLGGGPRGGAAEERRLELMELLETLDLPERVEEGPASEDLWPMSRQSELW